MFKKIIVIFCIFLLVGCSSNINTLTFKEIIDEAIISDSVTANINNKGYKYYLPSEFNVSKDNDFMQELISKGTPYYLNVDIVSYYYDIDIVEEHNTDDYEYYEFTNNDKKGYLRITKDNDNFFVELCYNYAIIEVEVEENELRYAVSRAINILKSIKYNDIIIEKYITSNDLEGSETVYKLPEPKNKDDNKNVLEYIEDYGLLEND